jgi:hypothetical protein
MENRVDFSFETKLKWIEMHNLYINLSFGFTTVCPFSISSQNQRPRHPNFLQADSKMSVEGTNKIKKEISQISEKKIDFFSVKFLIW